MKVFKHSLFQNLIKAILIFSIFLFFFKLDIYISFTRLDETIQGIFKFGKGLNLNIPVSVILATLIVLISNYFKNNIAFKNNRNFYFMRDIIVTVLVISSFYTLFAVEFYSRRNFLIYIILIPTVINLLDYLSKNYTSTNIISFGIILMLTVFVISIDDTSIDTDRITGNISRSDHVEAEYQTILDMYSESEVAYAGSGILGSSNLKIDIFDICCKEFSYNLNGLKSVGYLGIYKDNLIYVSGNGTINRTKISNFLDKKNFSFSSIDSNIFEIIKNTQLFDSKLDTLYDNDSKRYWESVKDLLIKDDVIYVSYVEEISDDCTGINIIYGDYNKEYINFDLFFSTKECIDRNTDTYNALQSGGKMLFYNDSIILSVGDFRDYTKPQNPNSNFGKILNINTLTKEITQFSLGHRNPQGLELSKDSNYILSSEHGPKGGDEINIISNEVIYQNFGWPISSYGEHYQKGSYDKFPEIAPLHKSHKDYGFVEPLIYFSSATSGRHGISDIVNDYFVEKESYFVSTQSGKVLYRIEINESKIVSFLTYKNSERVRDMIYDDSRGVYFILYEDSPSIGVMSER